MNDEEVLEKLKEIKTENFIWFVYIFIIFLSWYSNSLEKKFFLYNDVESKEKYRKVMIFIFSILLIIYFYFLSDSYNGLKGIKESDSLKKKNLLSLSFIASLFILISGFIFLYIAICDTDLNVELAFN